jgi:hypothetical protein
MVVTLVMATIVVSVRAPACRRHRQRLLPTENGRLRGRHDRLNRHAYWHARDDDDDEEEEKEEEEEEEEEEAPWYGDEGLATAMAGARLIGIGGQQTAQHGAAAADHDDAARVEMGE